MSDHEFRAVRETATESRLRLALSAAARHWSAAWTHATVTRLVRQVAMAAAEWSVADRVRYGAVAVVWAALGHLGCLALFPAYVAPGLPKAPIVAIALVAAVVAAAPEPFVKAWSESRLGRVGRRFTAQVQNNDA